MDKETKKKLEELKGVIDNLLSGNKDKLVDMIQDRLEDANKQEVTILIQKDKDGKATTKVEGERLAILLTLAGLEKTIIEKLNIPSEVWEILKQTVESAEVE